MLFKKRSKHDAAETASSADEIKKFYDLFQAGIITEEEFQKRRLNYWDYKKKRNRDLRFL